MKKNVLFMIIAYCVGSAFPMKKDHKVKKKIQLTKEIEVKIKPTDNQVVLLKNWLIKNASYKGKKHQKDVYFDNPKRTFKVRAKEGFTDAQEKLRIRFEKKCEKICYKYRHLSNDGKTLGCDELEVKVSDQEGFYKVLTLLGFGHMKPSESFDGASALKFLEKLGFVDQDIVEKDREVYVYDDFEIVVDNVKNLGIFIEVEIKSDEQDVNKGLTRIYALLNKIGFKKITQFDRSYLHMLWNPNHDFSEKIDVSKI